MVVLPSNHLLLLAEGGHCSLQKLAPDAVPQQLSYTMLPAHEVTEPCFMQQQGCVVSSNTLSASLGSGDAVASLLAVSYAPGVLHFIKVTPMNAKNSSLPPLTAATAAAAAAPGDWTLSAKALPYRHAVLSCSFPGATDTLRPMHHPTSTFIWFRRPGQHALVLSDTPVSCWHLHTVLLTIGHLHPDSSTASQL